ncbi:MAG: hypothetical protein ACNYPI_05500 [Arenicellales bacterium WSBS_2016_MAG_OTU3]
MASAFRAKLDVYGIIKDANGNPTGELMENGCSVYGVPHSRKTFMVRSRNTLKQFSKSATNAGVTTATDLFATFDDELKLIQNCVRRR